MEKKKKHKKFITTASNQEPDSNVLFRKEEQNQSNEALVAKVTENGNSSQEHLSSLNDQYSDIFQWPYTTQQAVQESSMNPRPCISSQTHPVLANRPQQVAASHAHCTNHPGQQGQGQQPFWMHPRPSYHCPAVTVPATFQPFTSMEAVGVNWKPPPIIGGTSSISQHQVPNICYQFSPYPGPWEPSSWWTHGQQTQPSFNYTFPGAYNGYVPSEPPSMPNCAVTFGESSQRGIIRPMAKLSEKHQQLWEAQSSENVLLWRAIGQLQSEIADYKCRLLKLETEVSSPKPSVDKPSARTGLSGAASKRGRPKRSVASIDISASPDESHPQARVRKPAASKDQPESKVVVFEKVVLSNVEKTAQSTSSTKKDNGEKNPFVETYNSIDMEINGSNFPMPVFHNHAHQEGPGLQIYGMETNSCLEMKSNCDKIDDSSAALSTMSQQVKENDKGVSAAQIGGSEILTWPASFKPEEPRRNMHNYTISKSLYENGCVIREAGKVIPGWSFVNKEDASDEVEVVVASAKDENEEDASDEVEVVASAKDENEEEMRDDVSSGADEIA